MHQFIDNIKRLLYWLPVIWRDRPWSGEYDVMDILHHKLADMERYLNSSDSMAIHYESHMRKLKIAKNLCERLADKNYIDNATMFDEERFDQYTLGRPRTREERLAQEWFRKKCMHSEYMEAQDREMLYKILQKYLPYWWD